MDSVEFFKIHVFELNMFENNSRKFDFFLSRITVVWKLIWTVFLNNYYSNYNIFNLIFIQTQLIRLATHTQSNLCHPSRRNLRTISILTINHKKIIVLIRRFDQNLFPFSSNYQKINFKQLLLEQSGPGTINQCDITLMFSFFKQVNLLSN